MINSKIPIANRKGEILGYTTSSGHKKASQVLGSSACFARLSVIGSNGVRVWVWTTSNNQIKQ